eukprot:scaffold49383_cov27-Tisochrysis_lutea.AAC.5
MRSATAPSISTERVASKAERSSMTRSCNATNSSSVKDASSGRLTSRIFAMARNPRSMRSSTSVAAWPTSSSSLKSVACSRCR